MHTIHVLRSGRDYFIDGLYWGDDEEGVTLYLSAKGISPDDITKALVGVAQAGAILSSTRTRRGPPSTGVVEGDLRRRVRAV